MPTGLFSTAPAAVSLRPLRPARGTEAGRGRGAGRERIYDAREQPDRVEGRGSDRPDRRTGAGRGRGGDRDGPMQRGDRLKHDREPRVIVTGERDRAEVIARATRAVAAVAAVAAAAGCPSGQWTSRREAANGTGLRVLVCGCCVTHTLLRVSLQCSVCLLSHRVALYVVLPRYRSM